MIKQVAESAIEAGESAERLTAAPDCGLGMLTRDMAIAKLTNMATAARSLD